MVRQTSIVCYNTIKNSGLLSKRRWEIYDIVYQHGPITSNETFDYSKLRAIDGYRHNASARMTELRESGCVVEVGTKICTKTGNNVILWDVTSNLPVKPKKSNRPKDLNRAINYIVGGMDQRSMTEITRDKLLSLKK